MNQKEQWFSDAFEKIYKSIVWIQEDRLRHSQFNNLSFKELHVINAISMYEQKTASQVAKQLHLTPATLTSTVNRLCNKGYVKRLRQASDRRVIRLSLTRKGRLIYRAHDAFHKAVVKNFVKGLSDEQVAVVEGAMQNLLAFLDRQLSEEDYEINQNYHHRQCDSQEGRNKR